MTRILIILFCTLFFGSSLQAQTKDSVKHRSQTAKPKAKPAQKKPAAKQTDNKTVTQKPVKEKEQSSKPATQKATKGQSTTKPATRKAVPGESSSKTATKSTPKKKEVTGDSETKRNVLLPKNDTTKHAVKPVHKKRAKPVLPQDSLTAKKLADSPQPHKLRRDSTSLKKGLVPATARPHHIKKDSLSKTTPSIAIHHRKDTTQAVDSAKLKAAIADSLQKNRQLAELIHNYRLYWKILSKHPYFAMAEKPIITPYSIRAPHPGKEIYFYTLAGILLLFAGFKTSFSKYFEDLTTLFFKRTLKQRQLQQQLSQDTLPSFLFNILFTLVAGFYLTLLSQQLPLKKIDYPIWQLFSVAVIFIAFIYLAKFFLLKLIGWLFNMQNLTDAYIFLIFLVNKIITLFLLPVIIIVALGGTGIKTITWALSWVMLGALFLYRFLVTVQMVQKNKRINLLHFLLYFAAFELLPAFVIYKFILLFLK
ncbi:DUF4271 domain-containing protein [Niabella soli]|uniref:DUF4271 domain-containing protein n=1 Tax=Niabella soli DSM 19437 TaxID=929713 RepID=W0F4V5_9BACT|nr:DUF4271 domain-containing protein [Niabella soli]AHF18042.1 hypothetical protein NIASO_19295 [Niabella soli DSM 19437]